MFGNDEFDPLQQSSSNNFDNEHDQNKSKKAKQNTKNTYIKKISSLMKITSQDQDFEGLHQQRLKGVQSQQFVGKDHFVAEEKEDKLAKNRESARNSRKRKKIYLELLESKVTKLSEQLEVFKRVYERNQELAVNLQARLNQKREQDHTKTILFANLQNACTGNTSENNIDSIIESLNKKFGSGAPDRQQLIEHYARQIYENCLSPHINYVLSCCKHKMDIFSTVEDPNDIGILKKLKLTEKQKQIILKKQAKLTRHYDDLSGTLASIFDAKTQIQTELNQFDNTLEQLRKELKPSQVARFLLAIEKKDMQHQFKDSFERCFGSEIDEDDSLELYQFMTEHNQCNSLGIDIQSTYEIFRASNDFLHGKSENPQEEQQQLKVE